MARRKPKYNNVRLIYIDSNGNEKRFYAEEVTSNAQVSVLIGMPVKDTGSRYITDSDIDFQIDGKLIINNETHRITSIPEISPKQEDNNSRRGHTRKDKVLITT